MKNNLVFIKFGFYNGSGKVEVDFFLFFGSVEIRKENSLFVVYSFCIVKVNDFESNWYIGFIVYF